MPPLAAFPIVSTCDPEEAGDVMSRELADLRLERVGSRPDFALEMNGVHLGDALVSYTRFNTDVVVNPGEMEDALALLVGAGEPSTIYVDGEPVHSDREAPIVAPPRTVRHHYARGGGFFILRLKHDVLERRLQTALDRTLREPLRFAVSVDLRQTFGAHLRRLIDLLAENAEHAPAVFASPLLRSGYNDLVVNTLLTAPSNYSEELNAERPAKIPPAIIRRAEAFLAASAADPVTIDQLVAECGCSRRALFKAFQESRGYTPMQFLAERRLDLARNALQSAGPDQTVTTIAYACGFAHPSRFAKAYRDRFGERPSDTLRK